MSFALFILLATPDAGLLAKPVKVNADHLEVLNREGRAVYTGHAHALRDETQVTCDELVVFYGKEHEVSSLDFKSNVEAWEGERHAWGENAHYDNATGVLEMFGHPKVLSGNKSVVGEKATFVSGSDALEVEEPKTLAPQQSGDQVEIEAHHLKLVDKVETATWTGEVKAKKGATRLWAPELTAHYDEKGEVKRLTARGGVHVVENDREAWGQTLDYDLGRGLLFVRGKPVAREKNRRMRGTVVTFFTNEDRIEVEGNVETIFEQDKEKKK